MELALTIFLITYVLLLSFPKIRHWIALASAATFIILGILPVENIIATIEWNVLMMIAGTMGVVALFIESKMPSLLADLIIEKTPNVKWATVFLALFAGIISAFVDNVATVLMVAPVALTIAKKLKISPVSSVIAIAISSNLQGAATLVGDTTSILLAQSLDLNFMDFFVLKGKAGLFWVVEAGALVSVFILLGLFRKEKQKISKMERTVVKDYFPTVLLVGVIVLLIIASFFPQYRIIASAISENADITNGVICVGLMAIGLVRKLIITKNFTSITSALKEIDYQTLLLLAGLFMVIGGISAAGVIDKISELFLKVGGDNKFLIYTLIVWASVIISAFIDNIPYVMTMLPVVSKISAAMGLSNPYLLPFGLLIGATLGGNITPIGASANIAGIGILRKDGYEVKASQFMRISVPFTLAAVMTGYILVWFIWS